MIAAPIVGENSIGMRLARGLFLGSLPALILHLATVEAHPVRSWRRRTSSQSHREFIDGPVLISKIVPI